MTLSLSSFNNQKAGQRMRALVINNMSGTRVDWQKKQEKHIKNKTLFDVEPFFKKVSELTVSDCEYPLLLIERYRNEISEKSSIPKDKFLGGLYLFHPQILLATYITQLFPYLVYPLSTKEQGLSSEQIDFLRTEFFKLIQELQQDPICSDLIKVYLKVSYNSFFIPYVENKDLFNESVSQIRENFFDVVADGLIDQDAVKSTIENKHKLTKLVLDISESIPIPFIRKLIASNGFTTTKAQALEMEIVTGTVSGTLTACTAVALQASAPATILFTAGVGFLFPKLVLAWNQKQIEGGQKYTTTADTTRYLDWAPTNILKVFKSVLLLGGVKAYLWSDTVEKVNPTIKPADLLTQEQLFCQILEFYALSRDRGLTNKDFNSSHEKFVEINKKKESDEVAASWEGPLDSQFDMGNEWNCYFTEFDQKNFLLGKSLKLIQDQILQQHINVIENKDKFALDQKEKRKIKQSSGERNGNSLNRN